MSNTTRSGPYRGRFAPTPSGPLHLGSLVAALGGFLQARTARGTWLLRIDDLDAGRSRPEFADQIQRQLEAHGLLWDETPRWQSQHVESYEAAFQRLEQRGLLYPCSCTRAVLARESRAGPDAPVYAGRCRRALAGHGRVAWRLRVADARLELQDPWQGQLSRALAADIGDFIVRRADGAIAYQLACVVDEHAQAITEVVRGSDLIGSSFRQLHLHGVLGLRPPAYCHLPVLVDDSGRKLSKQNHAPPLHDGSAAGNLVQALRALGQSPPAELVHAHARTVLDWAVQHWRPDQIAHARELPAALAGATACAP
jgi:glutamyl-Q tRNA(Asp) synthetase